MNPDPLLATETNLLGPILLQILLIAVNALFAMTEMACISINDTKLALLAEDGNKRAIKLKNLLANPSRLLSTIQIAITLAGFLGSAFGAENLAPILTAWMISLGARLSYATLNKISVVVITLILSYITLVFGELVPKRLGQKYGERIALAISGFISGVATVTRPVVWLLTVSTNGVLRLFGIDPNEVDEGVTEEEIRMMVDVGGEKGAIDASEREMIDNVFELNDSTAEELMTHRTDMVAFSLQDDENQIRNTIKESGYSRFPVYDEDYDDIVGMLHSRDFLLNLTAEEKKDLRELMRPAHFVPLNVTANVLLQDMQREKTHIAVVVDEYGGTNGIITMEDLLEEIVGNIYDEYDPQETLMEDLGDGCYRLSGSLDLDDVSELLGVLLPEEDFDTLGGMIFGQLSSIPSDGSTPTIHAYGLDIDVELIEDHRVVWAKVCKASNPESEALDLGK